MVRDVDTLFLRRRNYVVNFTCFCSSSSLLYCLLVSREALSLLFVFLLRFGWLVFFYLSHTMVKARLLCYGSFREPVFRGFDCTSQITLFYFGCNGIELR